MSGGGKRSSFCSTGVGILGTNFDEERVQDSRTPPKARQAEEGRKNGNYAKMPTSARTCEKNGIPNRLVDGSNYSRLSCRVWSERRAGTVHVHTSTLCPWVHVDKGGTDTLVAAR